MEPQQGKVVQRPIQAMMRSQTPADSSACRPFPRRLRYGESYPPDPPEATGEASLPSRIRDQARVSRRSSARCAGRAWGWARRRCRGTVGGVKTWWHSGQLTTSKSRSSGKFRARLHCGQETVAKSHSSYATPRHSTLTSLPNEDPTPQPPPRSGEGGPRGNGLHTLSPDSLLLPLSLRGGGWGGGVKRCPTPHREPREAPTPRRTTP